LSELGCHCDWFLIELGFKLDVVGVLRVVFFMVSVEVRVYSIGMIVVVAAGVRDSCAVNINAVYVLLHLSKRVLQNLHTFILLVLFQFVVLDPCIYITVKLFIVCVLLHLSLLVLLHLSLLVSLHLSLLVLLHLSLLVSLQYLSIFILLHLSICMLLLSICILMCFRTHVLLFLFLSFFQIAANSLPLFLRSKQPFTLLISCN